MLPANTLTPRDRRRGGQLKIGQIRTAVVVSRRVEFQIADIGRAAPGGGTMRWWRGRRRARRCAPATRSVTRVTSATGVRMKGPYRRAGTLGYRDQQAWTRAGRRRTGGDRVGNRCAARHRRRVRPPTAERCWTPTCWSVRRPDRRSPLNSVAGCRSTELFDRQSRRSRPRNRPRCRHRRHHRTVPHRDGRRRTPQTAEAAADRRDRGGD